MKFTVRIIGIIGLLIFSACEIYSQENKTSEFNFGFENISVEKKFPEGWIKWEDDFSANTDSAVKYEGKYSMQLESPVDFVPDSYGIITYKIPVKFSGQWITLKGKMKLENVQGSAGLLLRIDGKEGVLRFDNMLYRNITGTLDWSEYIVQMPFLDGTKIIQVGGILYGKGKLWLDDLSLYIDEKDIRTIEMIEPVVTKAEIDNEFDKGSQISITNLTEAQTENLFVLGRVWGFLKYYHPKTALGEYNWDYELFRITPKILNASNSGERNSVLLEWVNSLGEITEFKSNESALFANAKILPDLEWLKDKNALGEELTVKLEQIRNSKKTESPYYIGFEQAGQPRFKNETRYSNVQLDDGHKLLALFRYWNMIQYFFPNRHLIGEDWNPVLKELIPKFINDKSDLGYRLNVLKLVARVHDTHASIRSYEPLLQEYYGLNSVPVNVTFIEEKPVVNFYFKGMDNSEYGKNSGLVIGDEILSINGNSYSQIIKERLPIACASNYPTQLREIAKNFLRTNDSEMTLEISRNGKKEIKKIKCYPLESYNWDEYMYWNAKQGQISWRLINKDIGYINAPSVTPDSVPYIMNKLKDTKGIVIDIRAIPDELKPALGEYLFPEPKEYVKFTKGNPYYPGTFIIYDSQMKIGITNKNYYKGKVIILINEETQSSAEFTTLALRTAPDVKVIGSTTSGADGNVCEIYLPGGILTKISGIGVLTMDEKETQRVGIVPDVVVKPTIKGFRGGKDEPLLKAIEMIEK